VITNINKILLVKIII
jgi:hypothetical protein